MLQSTFGLIPALAWPVIQTRDSASRMQRRLMGQSLFQALLAAEADQRGRLFIGCPSRVAREIADVIHAIAEAHPCRVGAFTTQTLNQSVVTTTPGNHHWCGRSLTDQLKHDAVIQLVMGLEGGIQLDLHTQVLSQGNQVIDQSLKSAQHRLIGVVTLQLGQDVLCCSPLVKPGTQRVQVFGLGHQLP